VRVTTAFNRLLRLPGASVIDVSFGAEGVIVTVRLRRRRRVCSRCGQTGPLQIHDRRTKRWRHLDLGASRCAIECELRRLRCRDCGVHPEAVPWARPDAHHTRDFEDVVAWLAQQMAKTPIAGLLRIAWDTVGQIVERVVADHLDERRLEGRGCPTFCVWTGWFVSWVGGLRSRRNLQTSESPRTAQSTESTETAKAPGSARIRTVLAIVIGHR